MQFGPSESCLRAATYNVHQATHRGSRGAKKWKHEKPTMVDAACALAHYKLGHRWKMIFHNVILMHKIKLLCEYEICVSYDDLQRQLKNMSSPEEAATIQSGVDILYHHLFTVLIEYTGSSINEDGLFMIYTTFHNALWEKRIRMWKPRKMQKIEDLPTIETPMIEEPLDQHPTSPSTMSNVSTPGMGDNGPADNSDPCANVRPALSDEEHLAATIHPMLSNSDHLKLWGISTKTVDAYSLDGSEKKLIWWVMVNQLHMHMALNENGKLLFGRCCVHWCWKCLHAWDTVVSYLSPRHTRMAGGMEIVCEDCWVVLLNCLCFPGAHPPGTRWELLLELQSLTTGLPWTEDYPSKK